MAETNIASCDDILSSSHAQAKLQASNTIQKKLKATLFSLLCERNTRCNGWNISAKSLCQIFSICINKSTQMKRPQRFRILRLRSVCNNHEHQREIELNTEILWSIEQINRGNASHCTNILFPAKHCHQIVITVQINYAQTICCGMRHCEFASCRALRLHQILIFLNCKTEKRHAISTKNFRNRYYFASRQYFSLFVLTQKK